MFKLLPKLKSYCTTPLREVLSSYKGWQTNASLVCSKLDPISQSTICQYWEKWYFTRFNSKLNIQKWRSSKLLLKKSLFIQTSFRSSHYYAIGKYSIFLFNMFNNINEVTRYEQIRECVLQSPCSENFIKALEWVHFFELLMWF